MSRYRCLVNKNNTGEGLLSRIAFYREDCRCDNCLTWWEEETVHEDFNLPTAEEVRRLASLYPPDVGAYLLLDEGEVVYAGQVSVEKGPYRVGDHRNKEEWEWDSQVFFPLNGYSKEVISSVEGLFIQKFRPRYNNTPMKVKDCFGLRKAIDEIQLRKTARLMHRRHIKRLSRDEATIMTEAIHKLNAANDEFEAAKKQYEEAEALVQTLWAVLYSLLGKQEGS